MIFILENEQVPEFRESLSDSTVSYKKIDLYDRTIYISWGGDVKFNGDAVRIHADGKLILSSRNWKKDDTVININGIPIGGKEIVIAAGPCSVESEDQIFKTAKLVKNSGASILRGGAFKPRTSPYSFQGLGKKGIELLKMASVETGMPILTELLDIDSVKKFGKDIDIIQVGSRNGQNFSLLKFLGKFKKPVLLKNSMGNTVEEWLNASEYVLSNGNGNVILCYRGVRSFENGIRYSMDIGSILLAKHLSHLPVAADPSHPAGKRKLVEGLALGAIATGADMLEIEVHEKPDIAMSDSAQQLSPAEFSNLIEKIERVAEALGRGLWKK